MIHGIRDDQFDYKSINKVLQMMQKVYIKKIGCSPQEVTKQDYQNLSGMLTAPERCHICILAMESKKQIELLFLAKAVSAYMNQ
jgi:sestrin